MTNRRAHTFKNVLLGLSLALTAIACGKSPESAKANSEPQKILSKQRVRQLIVKHFPNFTQDMVDKMFCIAYAESNFDAYILSYAGARGLFQIMPVHTTGNEACNQWSAEDLWNEDVNAACAYRVYLRQGMDAWDPYYFAQRDPGSIHAQKYLHCRSGAIGWGE